MHACIKTALSVINIDLLGVKKRETLQSGSLHTMPADCYKGRKATKKCIPH